MGVPLLLLHKQSIQLHKLMSYFRGQSVHMHPNSVCMLPSLTQWFKLAGMWLLVAVLQVQINLNSPSDKEAIVFSQPGTQARLKWAGKYWYTNKKCLMVYLLVCMCALCTVSVHNEVHVFVQVCELEHCGNRPNCRITLSWYADILTKLAGLTPSLTGCIMPAKYFLYETATFPST